MFDQKFWTHLFERTSSLFGMFRAPRTDVRFALIYQSEINNTAFCPIGGGLMWSGVGIVNVGPLAFDPSTLEVVSVTIGNNNLPGPASVVAKNEGTYATGDIHKLMSYLLNPGEVASDSFGSLDELRLLVPEIIGLNNPGHFNLATDFSNKSQGPFVNTFVDLNYTAKLGTASASFTTRLTHGDLPVESDDYHYITHAAIYST